MGDDDLARLRPATRLVHGGLAPRDFHGFVNPPVVHASTVLFPSAQVMRAGHQRYTYGNSGTPTMDALEAAMNDLEGSERTVLCPSGSAACTVALAAVTKAGDRVLVVDNVYYPTRRFCDRFLSRFGVTVEYVDPTDVEGIARAFKRSNAPPVAALFLETPGSLTFEVPDVPALVALARDAGALVLLDNTWATPLYFRALDYGVDLVIHAATKYLAGHADLLLGTVSGNGKPIAAVRRTSLDWGENVAPDDVFATLRGLRTLDVRLERHQRNARIVAEWLAADSRVHRVLYPALPGDAFHAIFKRDFTGASGLFAFTLKGPQERADRVVNALRIFSIGASWGGFESLASSPDIARARSFTRWPVDEAVVRLSIGLEDPHDLIADLDGALSAG